MNLQFHGLLPLNSLPCQYLSVSTRLSLTCYQLSLPCDLVLSSQGPQEPVYRNVRAWTTTRTHADVHAVAQPLEENEAPAERGMDKNILLWGVVNIPQLPEE